MTETDWLTCTDPDRLVWHVRDRGGPRRWRLYELCACARRVVHLAGDPCFAAALTTAEFYADGRVGPEDLKKVDRQVELALDHGPYDTAAAYASDAVAAALEPDNVIVFRNTGKYPSADAAARHASEEGRDPEEARREELDFQCHALRDLFGNPFRVVRFDPAWRTFDDGKAVRVARGIYDARSFDALPVLADVLEEAGCREEVILGHCRQPAIHVRGCWLLDWLLGNLQGDVLYDKSLEAVAAAFLSSFEHLFHHDWEYGRGMMNAEYFISREGTFLVPRVRDESDDWGARGGLLRAYRVLRRVMEEKGIAPPPLDMDPRPPEPGDD